MPARLRIALIAAIAPLVLAACTVASERSDSPDGEAAPEPGQDQAYQCGDVRLHAEFEADAVIVHLGMGTLGLSLDEAASGARYTNRHGDEFHTKGIDQAVLTLAGEEALQCRATDQLPPWREAELRGAGFWAVGQEPGWMVEVNNSQTPALEITLDYGERELAFDRISPFISPDGGTAFRAESDDHRVELHIQRATCRDSMSGERFNATVELRVDDSHYQGCGRFLRP
ncbi:membrane-bound lysozyme inhibitor of c-type lysozyme MliC [Alkalispirillum mobile]|uniref:Membrane-bound lysozyme inhibitor of c-type lysozyme MliC n=1 Tax=Alkalispirillum mobile TaxID=85925 RepID=A0A498CBP6_9GAMM|nr:MliC family protein [Alkalispirillum mobile]RLK50580.1 membrane-bound lysozyme inhibitor of c-type lysozyme MliC [Alkalispirillum mobile]